jgi:hypothetical protein
MTTPQVIDTTEKVHTLKVGVVEWVKREEMAEVYSQQLASGGYQPVKLLYNHAIPSDLNIIFTYGPFGSLVPLANGLLAIPPHQRPALALLLTEQLPNPGQPEWMRYGIGRLRSHLERRGYTQNGNGEWRPAKNWQGLLSKGARYRYYGDLFWLQRAGLLTTLAVWSHWTADFLRERGFETMVPMPGYNPRFGRDLKLERDIPVLWLGKIGSDRRGRLLKRLRLELRRRGVEVLVIDGQENPYVFGENRTALLNRTKIMLNLLREKWDDNSMRFMLAAHNQALVISEPMLPHSAFKPGEHLIEAPVDEMADTIVYYLNHEEQRREITDRAYRLVHQDYSQPTGVVEIIHRTANLSQHPVLHTAAHQ